MRKTAKRLVLMVISITLIALLSINAFAASYPLVYVSMDSTSYTIPQGQIGTLCLTVFTEYHNEQYHVEIYDSNDNLIGTAEDTYYNADGSFYKDFTITIDTSDLDMDVGEYYAVYWMSFYSYFEWHDAPRKSTFNFEVIPNTCHGNHSIVQDFASSSATCDDEGFVKSYCTKCSYYYYDYIFGNHTYDDGTIIQQPDCTAEGLKSFTCTSCGEEFEEVLPKTKHTYTDNADQTCNACGWKRVAKLEKVNGVWKYYEDDVYTQATTLVKHNNVWYYVKNGQVDWKYTGGFRYGNVWYYIKEGKLDWSFTGLCLYNNTWYYFKNGQLDWGYNGLCLYKDTWLCINGGKVNWGYTGLCKYNNTWFYIKAGRLDWNFTGFCRYGNGWFYVKGGKLDWNYTGLGTYNGKLFYAKKGQLDWSYTGLCKYNNSWYYVSGGQVNLGYTGLCPLGNSLFYIKNGLLDWTYNGTCSYNDTTYTIKGGIAQ